jgi:hypothetical protein
MRPLRLLHFAASGACLVTTAVGGEKEAEKLLGSSGYPHILIGVAALSAPSQPPTTNSDLGACV